MAYRQLGKIFQYRHLLLRLALKELKVRYKHPLLGFLWALIVPSCTVLAFLLVFQFIIKIPSDGYPFSIFLVSAIFPWNFLNFSLANTIMSILENASLIKKVYFPREIIPISIVAVNLVLLIFSLLPALFILSFFGLKFTPYIIFLPFIILLQTFFVLGLSLAVSSLQIKYRDIKYIMEIILIFWFYLTPIFYPLSFVSGFSGFFFKIYMLNPLAQLITLYRIALIDGYVNIISSQVNITQIVILNTVICITVFLTGLAIFRKQEPNLVDLL